jgi:hypothetical protein
MGRAIYNALNALEALSAVEGAPQARARPLRRNEDEQREAIDRYKHRLICASGHYPPPTEHPLSVATRLRAASCLAPSGALVTFPHAGPG